MADEAFALSPIAARAALPTDADYEAIHEAFMETSRGRWFLTEYARRNRNTDTRMVLDAVERVEATLASQRQAQVEAAADTQADLWPALSKALARARIEIAQRLVRESNEEAFEAIRKSAETIKSVSWALRERGFDTRICDFLEVQVNAITDGYTGLVAESSVAGETEAEVLAAFDALIVEVETLSRRDDGETEALDVVVDAVADAMAEDDSAAAFADDDATEASAPPQAEPEPVPEPEPAPIAQTAAAEVEPDPYAGFHEIYGDDSDIEIVDAAPIEEPPTPAPPTVPEINRQRLYEAKFASARAVAPAPVPEQQVLSADDIEIVDMASAVEAALPASPSAANGAVALAPVPTASAPPPERLREKLASLGQALIESGVVNGAAAPRPDPLSPFRRMSQAEKVAFFT